MNAPHDPKKDDLDDLASALVDGLLDPDEHARAARDPDVAARVETIRNFRRALRDVPPPPAVARDIAVTAALDARNAAATDPSPQAVGSATDPQANVRPLAPRNMRPWLAAAAGVLVIALTAVLLSRLGDGGDDLAATARDANEDEVTQPTAADTAVGDDDASTVVDDAEREDVRTGAPEAGESTVFPELGLPDLGEVNDAADLTSRVITSWRWGDDTVTEQSQDAVAGDPPQACPALSVSGDLERGTSIYVAEARLAGERVIVHLYRSDGDSGDGDRLQLVATNGACDDLVNRALVRDGP